MRLVTKLPPLPARPRDANKGDFGRVLVVAGSRGMIGAACLAARAAGRGGAGLVQVAVPEPLWDVVATKLDEAITTGLPATAGGALSARGSSQVLRLSARAEVVVLGPGLSQDPQAARLVRAVVPRLECPLVLDADGLNAYAGRLAELARAVRAQSRPVVLTPHPGEMARLLGCTSRDVQADRNRAASDCARRVPGSITILKGASTLVTDGSRLFVNRTGNPGMATGGTGDVLAGLLAALIGQGLPAFEAACLAVHLHGLAGDLAARRLGPWSLVAGDLVDELPRAFLSQRKKSRT